MPYRLHVLGLPHTSTTKEFVPCAYTQKILNFCNMMTSLGNEVFLYSGPDNEAACTEHIPFISKQEQEVFFGATNWKKDFFPLEWSSQLPYWQLTNTRAIEEIKKRAHDRDFLIVSAGNCHQPVSNALPELKAVEAFVGYHGIYCNHRVFESYAWMHYIYGKNNIENGLAYDAVIPNYYDISEFPNNPKEDYCLFIGRMVSRKGIVTAVEATKHAGVKLLMAGQGVLEKRPGFIRAKELTVEADHVEHVGTVDVAERAKLMSRARAVFVPTNYIGPFEGVHVEAMLCGTPVITTDWGVFTETVQDGVDGYKCRTLGEFTAAIDRVKELDPTTIQVRARKRFGTNTIRHRFQDFFDQLATLYGTGWYDLSYKGIGARK